MLGFKETDKPVLILVAEGRSYPRISLLLNRPYQTIRNRISHLLQINRCRNVTQLIVFAIKEELIDLNEIKIHGPLK